MCRGKGSKVQGANAPLGRALGSANATETGSCTKLSSMTAPPKAITAATKHAARNARITFLPIFGPFLAHSRTEGLAPADKRPCSSRKAESVRFDIDEGSPEQADRCVKVGRFGTFEIDKEALDPWQQIFLEETTIGAGGRGDAAADQARHDLAKKCRVILRFRALRCFFDAEALQGFA